MLQRSMIQVIRLSWRRRFWLPTASNHRQQTRNR